MIYLFIICVFLVVELPIASYFFYKLGKGEMVEMPKLPKIIKKKPKVDKETEKKLKWIDEFEVE